MLATFIFLTTTIYLAQMGDKTQILTLLLATRTKKSFVLFFAVMTGFAISVTLALAFGAGLSELVPRSTLHAISGVIFMLIGIVVLKNSVKKREAKNILPRTNFLPITFLIFISDFGDKTQIAVALFSTEYTPWVVWLSAMVALGIDTVLMIFFSKAIVHHVKEHIIKRIAGVTFFGVGVYLIVGYFLGVS